jgi:hypothetical protein
MNSFKMASSGETIRTWIQDRATAIKERRNQAADGPDASERPHEPRPEDLPSRDRERRAVFTVSLLPRSSPSSRAPEAQFGSQTVKVSAWVETTDDRRINIEDVFADQQAAVSASARVASPLAFLLTNDFQDIALRDIRVEVEASEQPQTAKLVRAWLETDEVAPGGTVALKLLLRSYRGDDILESVDVTVPPHIRSGTLRLMVADAETLLPSSVERRGRPSSPGPRQLVRAINSLRKNNRSTSA